MVYYWLSGYSEGLSMTFAERLRGLREKAGLTQEGLAARCGVSVGTIRNYEQGIREPYWRGLFQLADALGVSVEAFRDCIDGGPTVQPPAKKGKKRKDR
jgi:transcriptional regulator with XRE-family HTH domain